MVRLVAYRTVPFGMSPRRTCPIHAKVAVLTYNVRHVVFYMIYVAVPGRLIVGIAFVENDAIHNTLSDHVR
jgi:hypothetical protein